MKTKLSLTLGLCSLALASGLLLRAQPPADAPSGQAPKPGSAIERLDFLRERAAERLDLTTEQRAKLDALRAARRAEIGAVLQDQSLGEAQRREKIRAIAKAGFAEAEQVLTPEQQEKAKHLWQAAKKHREAQGKKFAQGPGQRGPAPAPGFRAPMPARPESGAHLRAEMAARLDLTPEQRKQLADLRFQLEEKELALHKEMQALRAQMKAVLTPEQQKKLEHLRGRQPAGFPGAGFGPGPRVSVRDGGSLPPPSPGADEGADLGDEPGE